MPCFTCKKMTMKKNYFTRRFLTYQLSTLIIIILASSCSVHREIPKDDDGIYSFQEESTKVSTPIESEPLVIFANSDTQKRFEKTYFSKELERIDQINGTDIFTDIESYATQNDTLPKVNSWGPDQNLTIITIDMARNYSPFQPWGFNRWDLWRWRRYQRFRYGAFYSYSYFWNGWSLDPWARFRRGNGTYGYVDWMKYKRIRYDRYQDHYIYRKREHTNTYAYRANNNYRVPVFSGNKTSSTRGNTTKSNTTYTKSRARFAKARTTNTNTRSRSNTRSNMNRSRSSSSYNRSSSNRASSGNTSSRSRGSSTNSSSSNRKRN